MKKMTLSKVLKLSVRGIRLAFPCFITKDEDGFYVGTNLIFDVSTQARSLDGVKTRLKKLTVEYIQAFPEELERLKGVDLQSFSLTNVELDPNDIKIAETTVRS